jgi:hypothetical protein
VVTMTALLSSGRYLKIGLLYSHAHLSEVEFLPILFDAHAYQNNIRMCE